MKKGFLKVKAIFQIIVFIMSIFSIYLLNAKDVKAQEQNVCCAKTNSNEYCAYTEESNCDTDYFNDNLPVTCDQTSYCEPVCCYNSEVGECSSNVGVASCLADGYTYDPQADCNINECQKGCCKIGTNFKFITEQNCVYETSKFPDLTIDFDNGIDNEADCLKEQEKLEEGCCVLSDGTCSYGFGEDCSTFSSGGFNTGKYCSVLSSEGKCSQCVSHNSKGCYNEDVYWFDSCGNREDISDDCDYDAGTICGDVNGEFSCKDINCATTYDSSVVDYDGVSRLNGESWCGYEGKVGPGMDLVGSRHYRRSCVNGVELMEECEDYRSEFCVQSGVTTDSGNFSSANCMENRWEDCADECNEADPSNSDTFQEELKADKECCEDNSKRDCVWLGAGAEELNPLQEESSPAITDGYYEWNITNVTCLGLDRDNCVEEVEDDAFYENEIVYKCSFNEEDDKAYDCFKYESYWYNYYDETYNDTYDTNGKCVPLIPPGFSFWDEEEWDDECDNANSACTVVYKCKKSWGDKEYSCSENCDCRESSWVNSMNSYCLSLGDCGAHYNINCDFSNDGYDVIASGHDASEPPLDMNEIGACNEWLDAGAGLTLNYLDVSAGTVPGLMDSITKWGTVAIAGIGVTYIGITMLGTSLSVVGSGTALSTVLHPIATLFGPEAMAGIEGLSGIQAMGAIFQALGTVLFWLAVFMVVFDWLFGECDPAYATYEFECKTWEAPDGGDNCNKCNEMFGTCDEYRCRSLGKSCEIVNEGYSNVACERSSDYDVTSPVITADMDYYNNEGISISEFSTGFDIVTEFEAGSSVTIAVNTDKWAKCKYSETVNTAYDDMPRYIADYPPILKEHNVTFNGLQYGRGYEYYLRCENKDGFENDRDYKVSFFIKPGIDRTAPLIESTSIADNSYMAYNKNSTLLDISVRDDNSVECKWSRSNIEFDQMNNNFTCFSNSINGYFSCSTNLTDINLGLNTYYFACSDCASYGNGDIDPSTLDVGDVLPDVCNATERNTMQPIDFNLYGSNKLNIISTSPTGILYYNDITLMAGTSGGAENGKSVCRFNKEDKSFIGMGSGSNFFNTNSSTHTQSLVNLSGNTDGISYLYYIQCQDKVENNANSSIEFTVAVDNTAPSLLYIYKDESLIHVVLNEASKCQYSGDSFVYGNGTAMSGDGTTEHTVSLGGPYHVICEDMYGNLIQEEFVIY